VGTQSQRAITDVAGDDGIYSDNVSDAETSGVGYAWVYRDLGDEVAVELYDATAASVKDTALYSTAGWVTKVGGGGYTWKRLVVSSDSLTSGNNHSLRIIRRTGDASQATSFYADQCYFELGTTTPPTPWSSFRQPHNVYSAANEGYVNYIDATDILGDLDAPCNIKLEPVSEFTGVDIDKFWVAMVGPMADIKHWGEIDMSYDASRSNESRYMGVATASYSEWSGPPTSLNYIVSLNATEWAAMAGRTWRVLGGMRAGATTVDWRGWAGLRGPSAGDRIVLWTGKGVAHPEANQWCVVDLGPLYLTQSMAGDYSGDTLYIAWQYSNPV